MFRSRKRMATIFEMEAASSGIFLAHNPESLIALPGARSLSLSEQKKPVVESPQSSGQVARIKRIVLARPTTRIIYEEVTDDEVMDNEGFVTEKSDATGLVH
jgi:hypothetical protein